MCEWIVSWQSVKECSRSISIKNGGSDVRLRRCHVFWWDRFVQCPLGDVTYFSSSRTPWTIFRLASQIDYSELL